MRHPCSTLFICQSTVILQKYFFNKVLVLLTSLVHKLVHRDRHILSVMTIASTAVFLSKCRSSLYNTAQLSTTSVFFSAASYTVAFSSSSPSALNSSAILTFISNRRMLSVKVMPCLWNNSSYTYTVTRLADVTVIARATHALSAALCNGTLQLFACCCSAYVNAVGILRVEMFVSLCSGFEDWGVVVLLRWCWMGNLVSRDYSILIPI